MNSFQKSIYIVFTGLILASPSAMAQRLEENDPSLKFNGAWTPTNDSNASGGSYNVSNTVGSTVTFNVTGNFVLYRKLDPNGGNASITVDGNSFGNISFYSVQTVWQVPAVIDELSSGQHTIVLTVSAAQPQGSGGTYVYIDALQSPAPASLGPTPQQLEAITRTNYYRNLIGLLPARHHVALGLAANAHAQYLNNVDFVSNGSSPHVETQGASKYFTAAQPEDRDAYFGYTGAFAGSEDSSNTTDAITFVDGWMDGVDHRDLFVSYGLTQGGFGGYPNGATMDMAPSMISQASPVQTLIYTYPSNNQIDVWPFYQGTDGPDAANLNNGGSYGYPITLGISIGSSETQGKTTWVAPTGSLTSGSNTIPVNVSGPSQGQPGNYYMIPLQPLTPSTTYTATMSGVDYLNNAFTKTWQFTSSSLNAVHSVRPGSHDRANSFAYNVLWNMIGITVPSQLEYGPTTSYGSVAPARVYGTNGPVTIYTASMAGIVTSGGTVHYRVTATDAAGNMYTSPDHTITLGDPIPANTVGFVIVQPFTSGANIIWETAGKVASTQVSYGPTPAYGTTLSGQTFQGASPTQVGVSIFGLTQGTTYHYQITATDASGKTFTTPDALFGSEGTTLTAGLSGTYKLIPQYATDLCLDVYGVGTAPGTNMNAWSCTGGVNQSFNFVSQGNGVYVIQPSYATGLCLDVNGGGASAPGTGVDVWTCNGGTNQQWKLISDGGNLYELAPQNVPGFRLDVFGAGTTPGTLIDVWPANGGSNQKWTLTK